VFENRGRLVPAMAFFVVTFEEDLAQRGTFGTLNTRLREPRNSRSKIKRFRPAMAYFVLDWEDVGTAGRKALDDVQKATGTRPDFVHYN
jgi:hypothetical protein